LGLELQKWFSKEEKDNFCSQFILFSLCHSAIVIAMKFFSLKKIVLFQICFLSTFLFLIFSVQKSVQAAEFDINIQLDYSVEGENVMHIKETRTIFNNSYRYYIPASSEETFIITTFKTKSKTLPEDLQKVADTIKVLSGDNNVTFQTSIKDKYIEVKAPFGKDLRKGQSTTIILEYDNFELVEKSGNVWNIYVPRLPQEYNKENISTSGATTQINYTVHLQVDTALGKPNFVLPSPSATSEQDGKVMYTFSPDILVNESVWVQIGDKQYYAFKISQDIKQIQGMRSKLMNAWYDLVLPRESSNGNQHVYFESISPEPTYITRDNEGNIIARFTFQSEEETTIVVKGYIITTITNPIRKEEVGNVSDIDLSKEYAFLNDTKITLGDLLSSEQYWEVNADDIQKKAKELKQDKTNVLDILQSDYSFITESVNYDTLKIGLDNIRQGALSTLHGGSSVCMEYSDLLITILRAQGIPARAAFGYGFDPQSTDRLQEGHQWVEVYMPNSGWIPVDPTWGETGRKSYIGGDVDHALWYIAGTNVNSPSPIVLYSAAENGEIDPPKFEMTVVDTVNLENLKTLDEVLIEYKKTQTLKIQEKLDQLNLYGKLLFLGVPMILLLLFGITIVNSIFKQIQKRKSEVHVQAAPAAHDTPNNPYY
jgi:transglutaminase-like putative cysteine protease